METTDYPSSEHWAIGGRNINNSAIVTLRRAWQWLTYVHAVDPVRLVLNQGFAVVITLTGLISVLLWFVLTITNDRSAVVLMVTFPVWVFTWWLNRRGTVYGTWLIVFWSVMGLTFGPLPASSIGADTPTPLVLMFPILVATLFIRPQAGLWTLLLLMALLGTRLTLTDVPPEYILRFLTIGTLNLASNTVILMVGAAMFSRALHTSVNANKTQQRLNARLQQENLERQRAEEAQRTSEERYRKAIIAAGAIPYYRDYRSNSYVFMGEGITRMTGYPAEEVVPDLWETIIQEIYLVSDHAGVPVEEVTRRVRAGESRDWNGDLLIRTLSGEQRWINDTSVQITDEQGMVIGSIGILQDITERKRMEEALRASEERYRYVAMATRDSIYDWDIRTNTFVHNEAYQMHYSPNEPIGKDTKWWEERLHPDDRTRVMKSIRDAFQRQSSFWSNEYKLRRFDGDYEVVIDRGHILYDQTGQPIRMIGAMTNITERKRMEETLAKERNLLRTLIDNLPHYIYYKDTQARFVVTNTANGRLLGLESVNEAVGKSDLDFYPPDLAAQFYQDDMAVIQSGQALFNREEIAIDEKGNHISVLTSKLPLRDSDGQVIGLVGIGIDITERKQAEVHRLELAIARERTELFKEFLNTLSHDLKTPLTIINTSLYLLEKTTDPEQRKRKLDNIKAQADRLEKLIQDILALSQLDTVPELNFQSLDLNHVIGEIHRQFQSVAEERHMTLGLELDQNLPPVPASKVELQRALTNLVENALHYTAINGTVKVRTLRQGDCAVVEVNDNGIGINESDLPRIFEHFYRADNARTADTGGTGLGLAIVKKTVEMHRGKIEVESTPGEGSTFRVRLPIAQRSSKR